MDTGCSALTEDEIKRVEDVLELHGNPSLRLRNLAMFRLGCKSGFRRAEICSLLVKDVMNKDGSMKSYVQLDRSRMKGKKRGRNAPFHVLARESVKAWIDSADPPLNMSDPLFRSREKHRAPSRKAGKEPADPSLAKGAPDRKTVKGVYAVHPRQLSRILKNAFRDAEIPGHDIRGMFATHTMRKTLAEKVHEETGDIYKVQQALGQTSVKSTEHYLKSTKRRKVDEVMTKVSEEDQRKLDRLRKHPRLA